MAAPMAVAGGLSGGALVAIVGVPVLAYLAWKYFFQKEPGQAEIAEAAATYTHAGPRGERVFHHDAAQGILRALPGMSYSYPHPGDHHLVEIHPERGGAPPHASLSAANWLRTQNRRMSVMAPVYLPMPTSATRYLRLAPPGHEADLAEHGYAVLAYAQAHHRPAPGQPITGLPPTMPQRSSPIPTPVSQAYAELHPALYDQLTKILKNPVRPDRGLALANEFARSGLEATANVIATKASNAAAQAALGMPQVPALMPTGWVMPVTTIQTFLKTLGITSKDGKPLVIDGDAGRRTHEALAAFQHMHGLSESGVADAATFQALAVAAGPVLQSQQHTADAAHPGTVQASPHVRVPSGASWWPAATSGSVVAMATPNASAQRALVLLSLPATYAGVQQFQRAYGLPVTGLVDAGTWTAMQQAVLQVTGMTSSGSNGVRTVRTGAERGTRAVQQMLVKLNLLPYFAKTGKFDELTRKAIRSFQSARRLPANGVLDPQTAHLIAQAAAQTPATGGGSFSPGQYSGRVTSSLEPIIGPPWS
jgi:peptidoglycan hydrolase-like protein with peptidoglycan-binding domain